MRFDGFHTMEGRHLVFAYAAVILIQLGYAAKIAIDWRKLSPKAASGSKKAAKPA